jgi:hypothetical protein
MLDACSFMPFRLAWIRIPGIYGFWDMGNKPVHRVPSFSRKKPFPFDKLRSLRGSWVRILPRDLLSSFTVSPGFDFEGLSAQIIPTKLYCLYRAKNDLQVHISKKNLLLPTRGGGEMQEIREAPGFSVIHLLYA